jgi:hypothetical protein
MRTAFEYAIEARHELHVSGLSPYLARSWLMRACCADPITIEVTTTGCGAGTGAAFTG